MIRLFVILCFFSIYSFAHPHFFIDSKLYIKKNSFKSEWIFDRINSRVLLFDFDKNRNKTFDEDEKQEFIKAHFLGLKENNYNISLFLDDEVKIKPENIDVRFEEKRVKLSFEVRADLKSIFTLCNIDEKIYMAFKLVEINSFKDLETQKSEYDYCVGVTE